MSQEDLTNKFVMNRDFVVNGFGHVIAFEKDVPMRVPPILHTEAMRCGAVPLDKDSAVQHVQKEQGRIPEVQGEERSQTIMRAMDKLVEDNHRMSFGADGLPTTKAIFRLTGIDIEKNERNAIWQVRAKRLAAQNDPNSATITEEETADIAAKAAEAENKEVQEAAEEEVANEEKVALGDELGEAEAEEKPAPSPKKKASRRKK